MNGFDEKCLQVYFTCLEATLAQTETDEAELEKTLKKAEKNMENHLTASMNVFVKALQSDTEDFTEENLIAQVVEFRFLYEFANVIRNVLAKLRTQRQRMEQYGGARKTEVST